MCICDAASNTVPWKVKTEHRSFRIDAFSFSPDKSRLLSAGELGDVCIWDVSALLQDGTPSTVEDPMAQSQLDDSRAPRFLDKLRAETSRKVVAGRVEFSTNSRAVVAYGGYAPIPSPEHWPLATQREDASQSKLGAPDWLSGPPNYYVEHDGWIWRVYPGGERRRMRWLPPGYRYIPANDGILWKPPTPGRWDIRGHRIALATNEGRLVIIDASDN